MMRWRLNSLNLVRFWGYCEHRFTTEPDDFRRECRVARRNLTPGRSQNRA